MFYKTSNLLHFSESSRGSPRMGELFDIVACGSGIDSDGCGFSIVTDSPARILSGIAERLTEGGMNRPSGGKTVDAAIRVGYFCNGYSCL
jgi:hypothetical protein